MPWYSSNSTSSSSTYGSLGHMTQKNKKKRKLPSPNSFLFSPRSLNCFDW